MGRKKIEVFVAENPGDPKPVCYAKKIQKNECIRCLFLETCMRDSFREEISGMKEDNPDVYNEIRKEFYSHNLFDGIFD